jgi:hypothetical protein
MDPWYKTVIPRKEVREGRSFNPDEFAVALEQVLAGTAPTDYQKPEQFFARTYFTRALTEQVGIVLRRLSGQTTQAPPVLSFITQFGRRQDPYARGALSPRQERPRRWHPSCQRNECDVIKWDGPC